VYIVGSSPTGAWASNTGLLAYFDQIWKFIGTDFECKAWDADVDGHFFAAAVPDPGGYERFNVEIYSTDAGYRPTLVANLQTCGPQVAWIKSQSTLAFLGSSRDLRYDTVQVWDAKTKEHHILYKLDDLTENLELGRAEDGSVYVKVADFVNTRVGFVSPDSIHWAANATTSVFVESYAMSLEDSARFPGLPPDEVIESMSLKAGWVVTRRYGIRTLWRTTRNQPDMEQVVSVWGEISYDTRDPTRIHVSDMRYEPYTIKTENWTLTSPQAHPFPCSYYEDKAPAFVVHPSADLAPKGLLICAYGAYGSPTRVGSLIQRWRPLLEVGWAIASVCVPGSGDHDDAWKRAGQRQNRGESIHVFAETIQSLQQELGISPAATALYGRSAGGLLVISTATINEGLVGALYVESPYVDVLRTISNPTLPLTLLETKEFGIGTNPVNVISTAEWSPMEHIPDEGLDLFVVARSDKADLEVYPYEVIKWIVRARGPNEKGKNEKEKLLYIHNGHGHFTTSLESRAQDLALLENWLVRINNLGHKYKMNGVMRKSRKNRKNVTRKNRKNASRKNRRNNAPAANSTMLGGRRRKNRMGMGYMRKNRKSRKNRK
jgi:pimeloyl-ACP methyl ester carboxylesterase